MIEDLPPLDTSLIAFNVRCLRMAKNKTQAELAAMAGIDKSTVHRIERGKKVHIHSLEKVAKAMGETVLFLNALLPYGRPEQMRDLFIHRQSEMEWFATHDIRKRAPRDSHALIQSQEERLRLGRLGLVASFQAYRVVMPNGPGTSQVEIYRRSEFGQNPTYRDCVVVCIRGEILLRTGDREVVLGEGDSIGYSADQPITLEPLHPLGPTSLPPLVWAITANRKGHLPIEFDDSKRVRTRRPRAKS